nr:MAG TPA: hypothetical protein [Caudoviricetes sp.]
MGNNIEEDIELLQGETSSLGLFFKCKGSEKYKIALEHILLNYKRVLKENEQLRTEVNSLKKENEELKNDYENLNNSVVVKNYYIKNSIPIQKIKDKIEEIQEEGYWLFITDRDCNKCVEVLQQLLEKEQ